MNFLPKFIFILLQICGFALSQSRMESSYTKIKIGGIFSENSEDAKSAFKEAANYFSKHVSQAVRLEAIAVTVDTTDRYMVQKAVCDMISAGNNGGDDDDDDDDDYNDGNNVVAVFGPNSPDTVGLVSAICKKLQIPHFTALWRPIFVDFNSTGSFTRNLFPHYKLYSTALYQVIRSFHWKKLAIIYDSDDALMRLTQVLPIMHEKDFTGRIQMQSVRLHRLSDDAKEYLVMLKSLKKSAFDNIVLDCSLENVKTLLNSTHLVKLNTKYHHYFITNYDASQTIDFKSFHKFESNVTTIRLYSSNDIYYEGYTSTDPNYPIKYPTTEAAMISDAVYTFAKTLTQNETFLSEFRIKPRGCDTYYFDQVENSNGQAILDNINNMKINGRTGLVNFDQDGFRNTFYMEVVNYRSNLEGELKLAKYQCPSIQDNMQCDPRKVNGTDTVEYLVRDTAGKVVSSTIKGNKNITVIMRLGEPFLMLKKGENNTVDPNNKGKYEGFSIDLFNNISQILEFEYYIIVEDKSVRIGAEDPKTGWTGIVKDIMDLKADFAISDIVISQERKRVIDFSISFQTLGVSILYSKPPKYSHGLFGFVDPLSTDVWLYTGMAILFVTIAEWLLAKIADIDWEKPHPCDEDPEELENIWDMHNCIWLTVACFMQQGCDILPKGVPPRLVAVVWWFFGLIVTESYKATLAASLTKESFADIFTNIEELSKESDVRYGLTAKGATEQLFTNTNNSLYLKMWNTMRKAKPSVFVENSEEGMKMVRNFRGNYAFFCESTTITYYTHRDCSLIKVGDTLDSKEYGIGMPMNSLYRQEMNKAILTLKQSGDLKKLQEKWWEPEADENGKPYDCENGPGTDGTKPMGLSNVGGVFIVLIIGIFISLSFGFLEFLWAVRQTSIEYKITPREAYRKERDFNLRVWKLHRPIAPSNEQNSPSDSSDEDQKSDKINLTGNGKTNGSSNFRN